MKELIDALKDKGLPIPVRQCLYCMGTIYRKDHWFQCPTCGALSTIYGGCYESIGLDGKPTGASSEWKELCQKSAEVRTLFQPDWHNGPKS